MHAHEQAAARAAADSSEVEVRDGSTSIDIRDNSTNMGKQTYLLVSFQP